MSKEIKVEGQIAIVPLSLGREAIIDADLAEWASKWNWFVQIGESGLAYAKRNRLAEDGGNPRGRAVLMHRAILKPPSDRFVDHINGDGLDNRRANLRIVTHSQNMRNLKMPKHNTSGFHGVSWCSYTKKWMAHITIDKKFKNLGRFTTPEAAFEARVSAEKIYYGEYARVR